MKVNINVDIDNKNLFLRYVPSALVILLVLSLWFYSIVISEFGNTCQTIDAGYTLPVEIKDSTIQLTGSVLNYIHQKKYRDIKKLLDPSLGDYNTVKQSFQDIYNLLPIKQYIQKITIIGAQQEIAYIEGIKYNRISSIVEINYPFSDFIVEMLQYRFDTKTTIGGFRVYPKKDILNNFKASITDATTGGIIAIILMFLVSLVILCTLVLCIHTNKNDHAWLKHKWLWILFISVGLFGIDFNWATQSFGIDLFSFRLLGTGWFKAGCFSPLILNFSLPIGSIVFLFKYYGFKLTISKTN